MHSAVELPPLNLGILLMFIEPVLAVTWRRGHMRDYYHYNVQFFVEEYMLTPWKESYDQPR